MKKIVKTAGQVDYEEWKKIQHSILPWDELSDEHKKDWERHASSFQIQPKVEDVPEPKTDIELWRQATSLCNPQNVTEVQLAEFLRLIRERDGEPLEVTASMIEDWESDYILMEPKTERRESYLARQVNANRGVRQVPQVTEEMWRKADKAWCEYDGTVSESDVVAVGILNAELAKAGKLCR